MRVLIFAPNYLPATRYGGPVQSTHGLARGLVAQGHEVRVLTTDVDGPGRLDVPLDRPVDMDGVQVHYCPIAHPKRLYYSPAMARLARKYLPESDVVHVNGMFLWPGSYIARIARKLGKPVVISPRGMLMQEMVAGRSRLIKTLWIVLRDLAALRGATAIHVTSDGEAEGLRQIGLDVAPVAIIPNGINRPAQMPDATAIDAIWGDVPRGRRVAMLARIDWTKGVDLAIEATRAHQDAVLKIAGHDQIGLRAELESRLTRGDGSRVGAFVGPLDGADKWAFIAGADVLLAPSVRESFGMAVAEALAIGTPVIVTPGVGAKSIVERVNPQLVCDRDADTLARTLAALLDDKDRLAEASARAKQIMADDYTWPAIADLMLRTYRGEVL